MIFIILVVLTLAFIILYQVFDEDYIETTSYILLAITLTYFFVGGLCQLIQIDEVYRLEKLEKSINNNLIILKNQNQATYIYTELDNKVLEQNGNIKELFEETSTMIEDFNELLVSHQDDTNIWIFRYHYSNIQGMHKFNDIKKCVVSSEASHVNEDTSIRIVYDFSWIEKGGQ